MRLRGFSPASVPVLSFLGSPDGYVIGGLPGRAGSITVGSTTTGASGSSAAVVNSGSSNAAVLNFTIPRGDVGPTGPAGTPGSATLSGFDALTLSRRVATTARGGAVANEWTKIAELNISSNLWSVTVGLTVVATYSSPDSASVVVTASGKASGLNNVVSIDMVAKSGAGLSIRADSFKVVTGLSGTVASLWFRSGVASDAYTIYEDFRQLYFGTVTYFNNSAWQLTVPTDVVEASTKGVTAFGVPVMPTTATVTTPTRLPNYGNDYTALVNLAASADPHINSVVALLHGDGPSSNTLVASTNVIDSDLSPFDWTCFGDARVYYGGTGYPVKFGNGSLRFDGSNDYMRATAPASSFAFGTGDFTIEMWVNFNTISGAQVIYDHRSGANGAFPTIYTQAGQLRYYTNGADRITSAGNVTTGVWYHVAVSRVSGVTRMFLDGVQQGLSYTDSVNYLGGVPGIGSDNGTVSFFNGYMDEVRVTNGVGRYSAAFTAPVAAFPDPAAVTLPTAVGNSTVYTIRNTGALPVTVNSAGTLDGVKSTGLGLGASLRFQSDGSNWRSDSANAGVVCTTGMSTAVNQWARVASLSLPANGNPFTLLLSVNFTRTNMVANSAIVSLYCTYATAVAGSAGQSNVEIIAASGTSGLVSDSFKIVSGGYGTPFELWVKTTQSNGFVTVSELSRRSNSGSNSVTYPAVADWQSVEPVGAVTNVVSNGVTAFGAPVVTTTGAQALTNKTLTTPNMTNPWTNNIRDGVGNSAIGIPTDGSPISITPLGEPSFQVGRVASSVNFFRSTGNIAGQPPTLSATGTDTNVAMNLVTKGTGAVTINPGSANGLVVFGGPSTVNYALVTATATGVTPSIGCWGADTNVSMNLTTKGTGTVQANGLPVGVRVAVPATATSTGVVGQWSADASWHYVCTATNTWRRTALSTW